MTEFFILDQLNSFASKTRSYDTIVSRGRAAPLNVAQYANPRFITGLFFNDIRQQLTNPADAVMLNIFFMFLNVRMTINHGAFRDNDNAKCFSAFVPFAQRFADFFGIYRKFRYEDNIGSASNSRF